MKRSSALASSRLLLTIDKNSPLYAHFRTCSECTSGFSYTCQPSTQQLSSTASSDRQNCQICTEIKVSVASCYFKILFTSYTCFYQLGASVSSLIPLIYSINTNWERTETYHQQRRHTNTFSDRSIYDSVLHILHAFSLHYFLCSHSLWHTNHSTHSLYSTISKNYSTATIIW